MWISKSTTSTFSNDEYPYLAAWEKARADIESSMPTFDKEKHLSQLPTFLMQDSGPDIYDCGEVVSTEQLHADGAEYTKLFLDEVQYVETRTQHHLHRLNATGVRVPLEACRSKKRPKECKGQFPRDKEMNDAGRGFLVC